MSMKNRDELIKNYKKLKTQMLLLAEKKKEKSDTISFFIENLDALIEESEKECVDKNKLFGLMKENDNLLKIIINE